MLSSQTPEKKIDNNIIDTIKKIIDLDLIKNSDHYDDQQKTEEEKKQFIQLYQTLGSLVVQRFSPPITPVTLTQQHLDSIYINIIKETHHIPNITNHLFTIVKLLDDKTQPLITSPHTDVIKVCIHFLNILYNGIQFTKVPQQVISELITDSLQPMLINLNNSAPFHSPHKLLPGMIQPIGDLHANALLFLNILVRQCGLQLGKDEKESKKNYHEIRKIMMEDLSFHTEYKKLTEQTPPLPRSNIDAKISEYKIKFKENASCFDNIFSEAIERLDPKNTGQLILIGDILSDRRFNDYFIIMILFYLSKKPGIIRSIIYSNHDQIFQNLFYFGDAKWDKNSQYNVHCSVLHFMNLIEWGCIKKADIEDILEKAYFPLLKLIDYTTIDISTRKTTFILTHAPINEISSSLKSLIEDLEFYGSNPAQSSNPDSKLHSVDFAVGKKELFQSIDNVNKALFELHQSLRSLHKFRSSFQPQLPPTPLEPLLITASQEERSEHFKKYDLYQKEYTKYLDDEKELAENKAELIIIEQIRKYMDNKVQRYIWTRFTDYPTPPTIEATSDEHILMFIHGHESDSSTFFSILEDVVTKGKGTKIDTSNKTKIRELFKSISNAHFSVDSPLGKDSKLDTGLICPLILSPNQLKLFLPLDSSLLSAASAAFASIAPITEAPISMPATPVSEALTSVSANPVSKSLVSVSTIPTAAATISSLFASASATSTLNHNSNKKKTLPRSASAPNINKNSNHLFSQHLEPSTLFSNPKNNLLNHTKT